MSTENISALTLLGICFVVLKLTGYIAWSWWWVLAPFWGGVAILLLFVAVIVLVAGICAVFDELRRKLNFRP